MCTIYTCSKNQNWSFVLYCPIKNFLMKEQVITKKVYCWSNKYNKIQKDANKIKKQDKVSEFILYTTKKRKEYCKKSNRKNKKRNKIYRIVTATKNREQKQNEWYLRSTNVWLFLYVEFMNIQGIILRWHSLFMYAMKETEFLLWLTT